VLADRAPLLTALVPRLGNNLDWKIFEIATRSVSEGLYPGNSLAYASGYDRYHLQVAALANTSFRNASSLSFALDFERNLRVQPLRLYSFQLILYLGNQETNYVYRSAKLFRSTGC
jgi:hypothetical protein